MNTVAQKKQGLNYHLDSLLLSVWFLGVAGLVIVYWKPWVLVSQVPYTVKWPRRYGEQESPDEWSPDHRWRVLLEGETGMPYEPEGPILVWATDKDGRLSDIVARLGTPELRACRFIDNDTVEGLDDKMVVSRWHRRFPEYWWGHIYRPEVWAAFALGALWILRVTVWRAGIRLR